MDIVRYLLIAVEAFCSLILIVLILMQRSKSEGIGLAFGSGMGETLFGARAGNILTKLTIIFAVVFMANTLALSILYSSGQRAQSLMGRLAPAAPTAPPPAVPQQPVTAPEGPVAPVSGAPTLPGADFSAGEAAQAPMPAE